MMAILQKWYHTERTWVPAINEGALMSFESTPPSPTEVTLCFVYFCECIRPGLPSALPRASAGCGTVHRKSQGLWQGCRWCCGTGATDLVVHFHWPAVWCLARFVLLSGSPCRDVFSSNNSFPLIQVFPANTDSSSQYYRKTTAVCPYSECGRTTDLITEALNSNVKKVQIFLN